MVMAAPDQPQPDVWIEQVCAPVVSRLAELS